MHKSLLATAILCFLFEVVDGQYDNQQWKHYTIDDGLPSNECYDIEQDNKGYIWVATDRGLSRFDGVGFKNYGQDQGLKDISVLKIKKDHKNQIWLFTNNKDLYIYNHATDQITDYPFNNLIDKIAILNLNISHFYIDKEENLYFQNNNNGYSQITKKGKVVFPKIDSTSNFISSLKIESNYILSNFQKLSHINDVKNKHGQYLFGLKLIHNDIEYNANNEIKRVTNRSPNVFHLGGDTLLYIVNTNGYLFSECDYLGSAPMEDIDDVCIDPKGGIWAAFLFGKGIYHFKNAKDLLHQKGKQYLKGESCTSIILDREESIVVATLENGLFYLDRHQTISAFNSLTFDKKITQLEWISDSTYSYVVQHNQVYLAKINSVTDKLIYTAKSYIQDLLYDRYRDQLFVIDNPSNFIYNVKKGKAEADFFSKNQINHFTKKIFILNNGKKYLVIYGVSFCVYDAYSKEKIYDSFVSKRRHSFYTAIQHPKGIVLGGKKGLYLFDGKKVDSLFHIHPLFKERVNSIAKFRNFYLIGILGRGVVIWNGKDKCFILNEKKGLLSNNIESIQVTKEDEVFVSTFKGLSKLTKEIGEEIGIENFTIHNGLPSNEVFESKSRNGVVLVATGKGIGKVENNFYDQPLYQPIIEYIQVNNKKYANGIINKKLRHKENNITIFFKSLNFALHGDISYQYRIDRNGWQYTRSNSVTFSTIKPGNYTFEVRAANINGKWSKATMMDFHIEKPWWQTIWFTLLSTCIIIFSIVYFNKRKIQQFRKEIAVKNEIHQLQLSALQTQMNPHFIFNCLTAIQNFIMLNQKEDAMNYLARFAKLIRQNLNASNEKLISLDKEIDTLKNYIELEQLRYNFNFDFIISVDKNIIPELINIPPLLIQPFVENAIVHGLKNMKSNGKLEISFTSIDSYLQAIIRDNGKGIVTEKKESNIGSDHKSMGMSITQKRLDFINETAEDKYSIQRNNLNPGTEIVVKIRQ